uniref:Putative trypsin-like peptidase domain containing protein n=1 Tax=viral metagenome TaxID=1070528 RepID=A0A6M3LG07_9ZZZZ
MKRLITILILLFVGLCLARYSYGYDQMKPKEDPKLINDGCFTYVRIQTVGIAMGMCYDNGWKARETKFEMIGSGFVVKKGFIITASHVIEPLEVETVMAKYGSHNTKPFNVVNRLIFIYHFSDTPMVAKVHYLDVASDIAILKYKPIGILEPTTYEMEYCEFELKQNDVVFTFLHKRDKQGNLRDKLRIRYGKILTPYPSTPTMGKEISSFSMNTITLLMNVYGGDSGSPLFAFRDSVPIFIGIINRIRIDEVIFLTYAVTLPNIRRYLNIEVE